MWQFIVERGNTLVGLWIEDENKNVKESKKDVHIKESENLK